MRRSIGHSLGFFVLLACLTACGADSSGGYTPTRDTIATEAQIEFDVSSKIIEIVEAGPSVRSEVLSPCEISVETKSLSYQLVDASHLTLNGGNYQKARELSQSESLAGVPSGIFAVWTAEARIFDQVTNQIEIEIHPTTLIYRNSCSR